MNQHKIILNVSSEILPLTTNASQTRRRFPVRRGWLCADGGIKDIDYDYADPLTGKKKTLKLHAVICEESWEEIAPGSKWWKRQPGTCMRLAHALNVLARYSYALAKHIRLR